MSGEGFFRRWARLKSSGPAEGEEPAPAFAPQPRPVTGAPAPQAVPAARGAVSTTAEVADNRAQPQRALPTLEDAAQLTPDADFSAFVAKGVDKSVQRLALKALFADPHFKLIDGLDVYMSDYNKASPLTPVMLASLQHAQGLVARLLDDRQQEAGSNADNETSEHQEAPAAGAAPSTEQGIA